MKKLCIIGDCEKPSRRNEMCVMHDTRVRRHGNPHYQSRENHGLSGSKLYTVWSNMIARCENEDHSHYKRYGERGINICPAWRNSFSKFRLAMGDIPFKGATIDRKDNDKGYSKENCRWVTHQENSNNRFYDRTGVSYRKNLNRYISEIRYDGRRVYLGCYKTEEEAAAIYKKAAIVLGRRQ